MEYTTKNQEILIAEKNRRRKEMKSLSPEERMERFYNMMNQIWNNMSEDSKMKFHKRNLKKRAVTKNAS